MKNIFLTIPIKFDIHSLHTVPKMSFSNSQLQNILTLTNNDDASFTIPVHKAFQKAIIDVMGLTIVRNLRDWLEKVDGHTLVRLQSILKCSNATVSSIYEHLNNSNIKRNFDKICDIPGAIRSSSSSSSSSSSLGFVVKKPSSSSPTFTVSKPSGPFIVVGGGGIAVSRPVVMAHGFGMAIGGHAGVLVHKNGQVYHNAVSVGGGKFAVPTPFGMALIDS